MQKLIEQFRKQAEQQGANPQGSPPGSGAPPLPPIPAPK
jgi:hypothetical protein